MLKKFKLKNVIAITAFGLFSMNANAASGVTQVNSSADLKSLVNITNVNLSTVNFGLLYIANNPNATVTLDPDTGYVLINGSGVQASGGQSLATIAFQGTAGQTINISASGTNLSYNGDSISTQYTPSQSSITLNDEGIGDVKIGGILTIANSITPGLYSGTVQVYANY